MNQLVFIENDRIVTDSLTVAETFGKEHARVMRDIRELDCSREFRVGNFAESYYTNKQGRDMPKFLITQDGFSFLVMGYTGKEAARFKEMYIAEFNRMKDHIQIETNESLKRYLNMTEEERGIAFFSEVKHRKQLQQKLEENQPKIEAYDTFMDNENSQSLSDVAKTLDYGPVKFCAFLRSEKVLFKRDNVNIPYQQYIDREYFEVVEIPTKGKNVVQTRVTPKGVEFISRLIKRRSPVKLTFIREFHNPRTTK